jgi:hypothetical protein
VLKVLIGYLWYNVNVNLVKSEFGEFSEYKVNKVGNNK